MGRISEDLQALLQQRLTSIDQIEIVLLLRGAQDRSWSATEVAIELKMPPEAAAMRLFLLASGGLLSFEPSAIPRYRYVASDPALDALLGELTAAYAENRQAVASVVGAPADPLRSFSDAFKWKK